MATKKRNSPVLPPTIEGSNIAGIPDEIGHKQ